MARQPDASFQDPPKDFFDGAGREQRRFAMHEPVKKETGDYTFEGEIVSIFRKKSGRIRIVVEDERGLLFIFNQNQLERV